jgi:hypothetical protein
MTSWVAGAAGSAYDVDNLQIELYGEIVSRSGGGAPGPAGSR